MCKGPNVGHLHSRSPWHRALEGIRVSGPRGAGQRRARGRRDLVAVPHRAQGGVGRRTARADHHQCGLRSRCIDLAHAAPRRRREWHPDDPPTAEYGYGDALYPHIILSEDPYGPKPPDLATLLEAQRNAYASIDESTLLRRLWDIWPRYPREALSDQYPDTHVPVFLANGDLDPQTHIEGARRIAEHYKRPHQTFVEIPNAGHIALSTSQVDNSTVACGSQMWLAFMHDPEAPVDTSCLAHLRNLPWEGDARTARVLFRTADLWENP